jgi:hypothetical protein
MKIKEVTLPLIKCSECTETCLLKETAAVLPLVKCLECTNTWSRTITMTRSMSELSEQSSVIIQKYSGPDSGGWSILGYYIEDLNVTITNGIAIAISIDNIQKWIVESNKDSICQACYQCNVTTPTRYHLFNELIIHLTVRHPKTTILEYFYAVQRCH